MPQNPPDDPSRLSPGHNPRPALDSKYSILDPGTLKGAVIYICEHPVDQRPFTEIPAIQPPDQSLIVKDLEHRLSVNFTVDEAELWRSHLRENLALIRLQSGTTRADVKLLNITLPASGVRDSPIQYLSSHQQITDPTDANPMITGLLGLTGAQKLRDQLEEGDKDGFRLYKGMYEDNPVYFVDRLTFIPNRGKRHAYYRRQFQVVTEQWAERLYDELSQSDRAVLSSMSITLASFESKDGRHEPVGGRRRMAEVIKLHELYNLQHTRENGTDEGQTSSEVKEVPTYEGSSLNARVGLLMLKSAFQAFASLDVNDSLHSAGVKDFK